MSSLFNDLKFALRVLRKSPGFSTIAVVSLALGIGPNTAIFSLVDAVLFQDWGVEEPRTLVDVYRFTDSGGYNFNRYRNFELIEEGGTDVFEAVTHHSIITGRIDGEDGQAELVLGEMVKGNYFDVMGVDAALGRTFLAEEDATLGTHPVLVLGNEYWRIRFGADPSVVGSEVRLNGRPYTVVGVSPDSFRGRLAPGVGTDFWVPYSMYPHLVPGKPTNGDFSISARVRDGIEPATAVAAVSTIASREQERLVRELGEEYRGRFRLIGVSLADFRLNPGLDATIERMAALLFVAVGLVLLVACVNLAGFLLSRATDRRKEMAVRVAMGAEGKTIARQLLVESMLLATLGAALGLLLGQVAIRALVSIEPPLPLPIDLEVGLSYPLLAFTAGTAVVAALFFGLTPALESTRAPVAATLRDEAGSSGGRRSVGIRGLLVAAQMALSTILLFGAGLFVRSLQSAADVDVGFDTRQAAVVRFETGANEYTVEERVAFIDELSRRVGASPAVSDYTFTARMPLDLGTINTAFDIPGVEPPPTQSRHVLEVAGVTDGYFETMGIEILEGRGIEDTDREGAQPVAVLSEAAARSYWPNESAVGKLLIRNPDGSNAITVVGVAENVKIWSLTEGPRPYMYRPYFQGLEQSTFSMVARGSAAPTELAAIVRDEARSIDPEIFVTEVGTMDDHLGYIFFLPRMAALLLTLIGLLALVLACLGLYGMVSYGVSRRTREMGIRLALGSDRQGVVGLVLRGGLALVGVGAVIGIVAALALGRAVEGFLVGVSGFDLLSILAAPLILTAVALLATYMPARRASRVDPVKALRTE